ncbi:MAG: type II toxin-antitoxin system HicA family toxin [Chloroflexi bacterium]|nr:type II toxin-antitoxin system HicA family toxin [Chloroflexota bacterium]MBI3741167.1 type II toxin-antitoxin system HicA family toxin [Chloroflexota bacterium]
MSRLPTINFRQMEKVLFRLGFRSVRQKGSHVFYRHPDGRTTTVPDHGSRDLARPLIREILREIEIAPEQFREELEKI